MQSGHGYVCGERYVDMKAWKGRKSKGKIGWKEGMEKRRENRKDKEEGVKGNREGVEEMH